MILLIPWLLYKWILNTVL